MPRTPLMPILTAALITSTGVTLAQPALKTSDPSQPQPPTTTTGEGLPALLIDAELTPRRITVSSIDDANVYFRDEQGRDKRAPLSALAAIIAPDEQRASPTIVGQPAAVRHYTPGTLLLTDGRRYPGQLTASSGETDRVQWSHPVFGDLSFPLDAVAALLQPVKADAPTPTMEPSAQADGQLHPVPINTTAPPSEDWLVLVNGDRLTGFLESLGNPVRIEINKQHIDVPTDRLAGAALSNPRTQPTGVTVWLADGTIAQVQRAGTVPDAQPQTSSPSQSNQSPAVSVTSSSTSSASAAASTPQRPHAGLALTLPTGQTGRYAITDLRGIVFNAAQLRALSSLTIRDQRPLGERRWTAPIELISPDQSTFRAAAQTALSNDRTPIEIPAGIPADAYDLLFPGPMAVTFDLPDNADRVAGEFEFDPLTGAWADCEVVIRIDNTEAHRAHLAKHPIASNDAGAAPASTSAPFNIPILPTARTITIAIEPGRYGPIMDRVYVRRGLVLVGR